MIAFLDQQQHIIQELLQNVEPQAIEQTCQVRSSPQVTLGHIRMREELSWTPSWSPFSAEFPLEAQVMPIPTSKSGKNSTPNALKGLYSFLVVAASAA